MQLKNHKELNNTIENLSLHKLYSSFPKIKKKTSKNNNPAPLFNYTQDLSSIYLTKPTSVTFGSRINPIIYGHFNERQIRTCAGKNEDLVFFFFISVNGNLPIVRGFLGVVSEKKITFIFFESFYKGPCTLHN